MLLESSKQLETLYNKMRDGEDDATEVFLNFLRADLFDLLMRMTGQLSRSLETIDETFTAMTNVDSTQLDLSEFLCQIIKTARNFSADIWDANTSKLENEAYAQNADDEMYAFEKKLRCLPSEHRECIILKFKLGFPSDQVAKITGFPLSDVETVIAQGAASLGSSESDLALVLKELRNFPLPEHSDDLTKDLSMIIKAVKRSNSFIPTRVYFLLGIVIALAITFIFLWQKRKI